LYFWLPFAFGGLSGSLHAIRTCTTNRYPQLQGGTTCGADATAAQNSVQPTNVSR
jgi:hypothetical protein